jgi:hypothetical protein
MVTAAVLKILRALGFGGLLGAGTFGVVYVTALTHLSPAVTLSDFAILGGLVGAGATQMISSVVSFVSAPLLRRTKYYVDVAELRFQVQQGLISEEVAIEISEDLARQHFLGNGKSGQKRIAST